MDFKKGDKVMIRYWDDMKEEFGLTPGGGIDCPYTFVQAMRRFCGQTAYIHNVDTNGHVCFEDCDAEESFYNFSTDMLILVERTAPREMTIAEIEKELGYKIKIIKEEK